MVRSVISLGWVIEGPIKACLRSRKVRKVIKAFTERETVLVSLSEYHGEEDRL